MRRHLRLRRLDLIYSMLESVSDRRDIFWRRGALSNKAFTSASPEGAPNGNHRCGTMMPTANGTVEPWIGTDRKAEVATPNGPPVRGKLY